MIFIFCFSSVIRTSLAQNHQWHLSFRNISYSPMWLYAMPAKRINWMRLYPHRWTNKPVAPHPSNSLSFMGTCNSSYIKGPMISNANNNFTWQTAVECRHWTACTATSAIYLPNVISPYPAPLSDKRSGLVLGNNSTGLQRYAEIVSNALTISESAFA